MDKPEVSDIINNDYVLITLYVDNKTPLPSPVKIVENGTERTLRTVGDKWSYRAACQVRCQCAALLCVD